MTGITHQMIAIVAGLWILTLYPVQLGWGLGIIALIAIMMGALLPDIDHPAASIWHRYLGGVFVGSAFRMVSGGHRHFTHSVLAVFGIGWVLQWLVVHVLNAHFLSAGEIVWRAFMIGFISHLLADTLTDRGVPWLWPLPLSIKIPPGPEIVRVTTGSFVEMILLRGSLVVIAFLIISSHKTLLLSLIR